MRVILIISTLLITGFTNARFYTLPQIGSSHVNNNDTLLKDKQSLIKYAEPILFKTYGKKTILSEKPYIISFKNGTWSMSGTLPREYTIGGTFHILINAKDGRVIKIIHYK
jgi:hypothetical protein